LVKSASIKMRLLQAHGKLVSFVLILNFNADIEFLNLLSLTRLKFPTVIIPEVYFEKFYQFSF
jgi:hypothetical protein